MFVLTLIFYLKSKSKRNLVAKVATKPEFFSLHGRHKKGREGGGGEREKHERGEREGSTCYKSWFFVTRPPFSQLIR